MVTSIAKTVCACGGISIEPVQHARKDSKRTISIRLHTNHRSSLYKRKRVPPSSSLTGRPKIPFTLTSAWACCKKLERSILTLPLVQKSILLPATSCGYVSMTRERNRSCSLSTGISLESWELRFRDSRLDTAVWMLKAELRNSRKTLL